MKTFHKPWYSDANITGRFTDTTHLIDLSEYEKLKDEAIMSVFSGEGDVSKEMQQILSLQYNISQLSEPPWDLSVIKLAKHFGTTRQTIYNWREIIKKYPEIGDGSLFSPKRQMKNTKTLGEVSGDGVEE